MFMTRSLLIRLSIVFVVIISLGFFFRNLIFQKELTPPVTLEKEQSISPFSIKGFSHSAYHDDKLIAKIAADELTVKQRKLFVFNVRPFHEAVLTNAKFEFHLYENMPSEADLLSSAKEILSVDREGRAVSKEMGLITRGVIKGLVLKMYKAEDPYMLIKAKKAYMDFRNGTIKMQGVVLDEVITGKTVESGANFWSTLEEVQLFPTSV